MQTREQLTRTLRENLERATRNWVAGDSDLPPTEEALAELVTQYCYQTLDDAFAQYDTLVAQLRAIFGIDESANIRKVVAEVGYKVSNMDRTVKNERAMARREVALLFARNDATELQKALAETIAAGQAMRHRAEQAEAKLAAAQAALA